MAGAVKEISKLKCFFSAVKLTFIEYAAISSIQGFQYLVDARGNFWTKLIWIAICASGIVYATSLMLFFWERHIGNPTRISIESNHARIPGLLFPSITFCHINQISEIRASLLAKKIALPPNVSERQFSQDIHQAAGFIHKVPYNQIRLRALDEIFASNRLQAKEVMSALVQPCDEYLIKCRWEGAMVPCRTIFDSTFTYYGSCCTFNLHKKIIFTNHFGSTAGLSVALRPLIEKGTISSVFSNGLRVLIHDSRHYVSDATAEKVLQVKSESIIRIYGTETICDDSVRELSVARRNCLFKHERKLRFFDDYSDSNCDTDCLFRQILGTCGCLPYNYAILPNASVCNFTQINCLMQNYQNFHEGRDEYPCHCPQDCDSTSFNIVTNKINFRPHTFERMRLNIDPFYGGLDDDTIIVHLSNAKQVFRIQKRVALTNIIYLAANFGGVYSLFVGVSVITLLEIIYFATVRVVRRHNQLYQDQTQLGSK